MLTFTEVDLGTYNLKIPYEIKHTIEDPKASITGYIVQQRKGFLFTKKMLSLNYENLTTAELNNTVGLFSLKDPLTIFKITLFNLITYKLAKPLSYKVETFNSLEAGLLVKKHNLSFSCRIIQ